MLIAVPDVNLTAVLIAAISASIVGFVWYGPLFGKPWIILMGIKKEDIKMDKMRKTYFFNFIGTLIMAYVLSVMEKFMGSKGLVDGMMAGFWAWIGFVAPVQMTEVLFGGKSWNLFYINTGYQLTSLLVMGAVIIRVG